MEEERLFFNSLESPPSRASPGSSSASHQARHPEAGVEWKTLSRRASSIHSEKSSLPSSKGFLLKKLWRERAAAAR